MKVIRPNHYVCEGCLNWDDVNGCWANYENWLECPYDPNEDEEDEDYEGYDDGDYAEPSLEIYTDEELDRAFQSAVDQGDEEAAKTISDELTRRHADGMGRS